MSKVRLQRHNQYKGWQLSEVPMDSVFPAEAALAQRIRETGDELFAPYQFSFHEDDAYHYHLAFLVEAVELLPLKIDLAFDAIWRAFESLYAKQLPPPMAFKLGDIAPSFAGQIEATSEHDILLNRLLEMIPVQSCEYIAQRIFRTWNQPQSDYQKIWNRLENPPNNHNEIKDLLGRVATKYAAPNFVHGDERKAAMLLRLVIQGSEVEVGGVRITVPRAQRISFLLNALLYTFRNDRFHGSMQPPFKSSIGTIRTYAHVHYCFIWAHYLFLFRAMKNTPALAEAAELAANTLRNLESMGRIYGKHLRK
jgi:hypothetical protein